MATHTAVIAQHATLSGTTQDVVSITGASKAVMVLNRHSSEILWAKIGASDSGSISASGDDIYAILPNTSITFDSGGWLPVVVRLLGNSNPYSVQAL